VWDGANDPVNRGVPGNPAPPTVCPVVWPACRALGGASRAGVVLTPAIVAADAWFTLEDDATGTQVQSPFVIPAGNVAVEHPLLPIVRRASASGDRCGRSSRVWNRVKPWRGDAFTFSPGTLRVIPTCGSSGRCSDSRHTEFRRSLAAGRLATSLAMPAVLPGVANPEIRQLSTD
jgi:hypothetical protein